MLLSALLVAVTAADNKVSGGGLEFGFYKAIAPKSVAASKVSAGQMKLLKASWDNTNFAGAFDAKIPLAGDAASRNTKWAKNVGADPNSAVNQYASNGAIYASAPPVWSNSDSSFFKAPKMPELPPMEALPLAPPMPETPPALPINIPKPADAGKCQGGLVNSVDAYFKCSAITGGLFIQNTEVVSLDAFVNIAKLEGNGVLQIANNKNLKDISGLGGLCGKVGKVVIANNPKLKNVNGLNCIKSSGQVIVSQNVALEGISGLNGLSGDIAFGLGITKNDKLRSLKGLEGVSSIGFDKRSGIGLQVSGNRALIDLKGIVKVEKIRGSALVSGNNAMVSMMNSAVVEGKDKNGVSLSVSNNKKLRACEGFVSQSPSGSVEVIGNRALRNLACIVNMKYVGKDNKGRSISASNNAALSAILTPKLVKAEGSIIVQNTAVKSINMKSLSSIGRNAAGKSLVIGQNSKLVNMVTNTQHISGSVHIFNNPNAISVGLSKVKSVGKDNKGVSIEFSKNGKMKSISMDALEKSSGSVAIAAMNSLVSGFKNLKSVGVAKNGNSVEILQNPKLANGGLCNLQKAQGAIKQSGNSAAKSACLGNLKSVGKNANGQSIVIANNKAVKNVNVGVNGAVPGSIVINNNPALEMLTGLSGVKSVGSDKAGNSLEIAHNAMLKGIEGMRACSKLEGALTLQNNPQLSTLKGLKALTKIGGKNILGDSILIYGNPMLKSLHGLDNLHGSVPGAISLQKNGLTTLVGLGKISAVGQNKYGNSIEILGNQRLDDLMGLMGIKGALPGAVSIANNPALSNLKGLSGVTAINGKNLAGGSLVLANNGLKSINGICGLGGSLPGSLTVTGNALLRTAAALKGLNCKNPIKSASALNIHLVKCVEKSAVSFLLQVCHTAACKKNILSLDQCTNSAGSNVLVGSAKGKICGGTSGLKWADWSVAGSSGLYMDVDTSSCKFPITPAYVSSVTGDSAHWQLVGVNSIYSATKSGFRVYVWHPVLRGNYLKYFAMRYKWKVNWLASSGMKSGITRPGKSNWKQYTKDTIYVDVNTKDCKYSGTPSFVTSLHGLKDHWRTTGVHSIYTPTKNGFRVYVAKADNAGLLASSAEANKWAISWIGSQDSKFSGVGTSTSWKMFCASRDNNCGQTAQYYALFNDVNTAANGFQSTPSYVTSISGTGHHLLATGGAAIYRATKKSFRIYLDKAPTPLVAQTAGWKVNYIAYENPMDCKTTSWSQYGSCSKKCGGGVRKSTRTVTQKENHSGKCGALVRSSPCNTHSCDIDCSTSKWSAWTKCSKTCGMGGATRHRVVMRQPAVGGKACGSLKQSRMCTKGACPVHCQVSKWSAFGKCTKSCGGGLKTHVRSVVKSAKNAGRICPTLAENVPCNAHSCPVDCKMTAWSKFSACSKSCGGGSQFRTRHMTANAALGGAKCATTVSTQKCNTGACPKDCKVTTWSDWSSCDKTCGVGGTQSRSRKVTNKGTNGKKCPSLSATRACFRGSCPVHCKISAWTAYSKCSKSCGSGSKSRSRKVLSHANHGGYKCPMLSETRSCNDAQCPVDCVLSKFGKWYACTKTCGGGKTYRYRDAIVYAKFGGKKCAHISQNKVCGSAVCPVACVVGKWSAWSACDKTCGIGSQTRSRLITRKAAGAGKACGTLNQKQVCTAAACPIHCTVGKWTAWSKCTRTCGTGSQFATRINKAGNSAGNACPAGSKTQSCNAKACPVDCVLSAWSKYGDCTAKCGTGVQRKMRSIMTARLAGGKPCGALQAAKGCNTQACPVNCVVSAWTKSACTRTCGTGVLTETRTATTKAANGGKACPKLSQQAKCNTFCCAGTFGPAGRCKPCPVNTANPLHSSNGKFYAFCDKCVGGTYSSAGAKTCNKCGPMQYSNKGTGCFACKKGQFQASAGSTKCLHCAAGQFVNQGKGATCITCPAGQWTNGNAGSLVCVPKPVACVLSKWSAWSKCTKSCGFGRATRTRREIISPRNGAFCAAKTQHMICNNRACPVDCVVSAWSAGGSCSKSCGTGYIRHTRSIVTQSQYGGKSCAVGYKTTACNTSPCPVDCQLTTFTPWGSCSKQCGTGTQTRTRSVARVNAYNGAPCGTTSESQSCNTDSCTVHCAVTAWSSWSACTEKCGTGYQTRKRHVAKKNNQLGNLCPHLSSTRACNTHACPIDCIMGSWSAYGACSTSCGAHGRKMRSRSVNRASAYNGKACGVLSQITSCTATPCPTNCAVGAWSNWKSCSKTCGAGTTYRSRAVTLYAASGGRQCPPLKQTTKCNTAACNANCVVSKWGLWSVCTKTCGSGSQVRVRNVLTKAVASGTCAALQETKACKTNNCPIDCKVGAWSSSWTQCSASCGTGNQLRYRNVARAAAYGGKACASSSTSRTCNTHNCPTDCVIGSRHGSWTSCSRTCGQGTKTRNLHILVAVAYGGKPCSAKAQTVKCNAGVCPKHCKVSVWTAYGICSKKCGSGEQTRTRTVTQTHAGAGTRCPVLSETNSCNTQACPVDCIMGAYQSWTGCSATCGGGVMSRNRITVRSANNGGKACGSNTETKKCNTQVCAIDCAMTAWAMSGSCSKTCGTGVQTLTRSIKSNPVGGRACGSLTKRMHCSDGPCPVHCTVSGFSAWSACDAKCGSGRQQMTRTVLQKAAMGGVCPKLVIQRACNTSPCAQHCSVSKWGAFEPCQAISCQLGTGKAIRRRSVLIASAHGGNACPTLVSTKACKPTCDKHCTFSKYGAWAKCSRTCGTGVQVRSRTVVSGNNCRDPLTQSQQCGIVKCPINCQMGNFGYWTSCTKTCGVGSQSAYRSVRVSPAYGGKKCESSQKTQKCNTAKCATNCAVSAWTAWSKCGKTCGSSKRTRTRVVTVKAANGGSCLNALTDYMDCNHGVCGVSCIYTKWTAFSQCTATCGSGTTRRTRKLINVGLDRVAGLACTSLAEQVPCNTQSCPVDCVQGQWGPFSACAKSCGTGVTTKRRSTIVSANHGGKACGPTQVSSKCNTAPCAIDCVMGSWNKYSACSAQWGVGTKTAYRVSIRAAAFGGAACPTNKMTIPCSNGPKPVHCAVSAFSRWSKCSVSCGGGTESRSRTVTQQNKHGGSVCPSLFESRVCKNAACPVDCVQSAWVAQSCTKSCGSGVKRSTRSTNVPALYGGKQCGPTFVSVACNTHECPVNCAYGPWESYGRCSKSCDVGGTKTRTRKIARVPLFGGKKCTATAQTEACFNGHCPKHCVVSAWSKATKCTKSCGTGWTFQTRKVVSQNLNGGSVCPSLNQKNTCNTHSCPIDCLQDSWTQYTTCTKSCGLGTTYQTRSTRRAAQFGGKKCGASKIVKNCNAHACPVDCITSGLGKYSVCTKTCGLGTSTAKRQINRAAAFGGKACRVLSHTKPCHLTHCPIHCALTLWGKWTQCSKSCGKGFTERRRKVTTVPMYGGAACGSLLDSKDCNTHACPTHCVMGAWSDYSSCSKSCGPGKKVRRRNVVTATKDGGKACPATTDTIPCQVFNCPVHCVVSAYSSFGKCSKSCGGGVQYRTRTVTQQPKFAGYTCPYLKEGRACNLFRCPVDCQTSSYTPWSSCSKSCMDTRLAAKGHSSQSRVGTPGIRYSTRKITVKAESGGKPCPALYKTEQCNQNNPCQVHCQMSGWTGYSACTKSCGIGHKWQTRKIIVHSAHGGSVCGATKYTTNCNTHRCPVDCKVSHWHAWGKCSHSCLGASGVKPTQWRARKILTHVAHGGKACPVLRSVQYCNGHHCPIDCRVSSWTAFTQCNAKAQKGLGNCGYGTKKRTRVVTRKGYHAGKPCPTLKEQTKCYAGPCALHCTVSNWAAWSGCSRSCKDDRVGALTPKQNRKREITSPNLHGGAVCPKLLEVRDCNTQFCSIDCVVSKWSSFEPTMGNTNTLTRKRSILRSSKHNGKKCPHTVENKKMACSESVHYGQWSACTKKCGTGKRWRSRKHVYCSKQAAMKYDFLFRQGADCNIQDCVHDKDRYIEKQVAVPKLPGFNLDESAGSWVKISPQEQSVHKLPAGDWSKFV